MPVRAPSIRPISPAALFLLAGATAACGQAPFPGPGQTVHWTAAMSPIQISGQPSIPDTATLIVDPGVTINIAANSYILVSGQMVVQGQASNRVTFNGPTSAAVITLNGSLDFSNANVNLQVGAAGFEAGLDLDAGLFRDCTFGPGALINASWRVNVLERCTYNSTRPVYIRHAARVSDFTSNRTIHLREGVFSLRNVSVSGAAGPIAEESSGLYVTGHIVPTAIDNVAITNNQGAGIFTRFGNVHIGANTTIQSNLVAVQVDRVGGLITGSHVPATGNTLNGFVPIADSTGAAHLAPLPSRPTPVANAPSSGPDWYWGRMNFTDTVWGNVGVPYAVTGLGGSINGGSLTVAGGVSALLAPDCRLSTYESGRMHFRGTPSSPVLLTRLDPAQPWLGTTWGSSGVLSCTTIEGATLAMGTGGATTMPELLDCIIRENDTGILRGARPRKTQFINNTVAAADRDTNVYQSRLQLSSGGGPNAFVGNGTGVYEEVNDLVNSVIDASNNWWGSPSGPQAANNPGGTGDSVVGYVNPVPFLTAAPDFTDRLPIVRIKPTGLLEPLSKTTLRWEASDDRGLAGFRVSYNTGSNLNNASYIHLADLPPTAREYELTIPDVAFFNSRDTFIRVTAIDSAGQISVDELETTIPNYQNRTLQVNVITDFGGRVVRPGEQIDPQVVRTTFDPAFSNSFEVYLQLDNDGVLHHVGNGDVNSGIYLDHVVPAASTDAARLAVKFQGTGNIQKWFYTPPFAIRPDDRFGDAAPTVSLAPVASTAAAGSMVNLSWTASDDDALRMFRILQSTDAGRTWHLVEDNIPAAARTFPVKLAPGAGLNDLRLCVVAVDSIFQNSSSTTGAITVTPGSGSACYANCDSSTAEPVLNVADFTCFLQRFAAGDAWANCDQSTAAPTLNVADFTCFLQRFAAGCR